MLELREILISFKRLVQLCTTLIAKTIQLARLLLQALRSAYSIVKQKYSHSYSPGILFSRAFILPQLIMTVFILGSQICQTLIIRVPIRTALSTADETVLVTTGIHAHNCCLLHVACWSDWSCEGRICLEESRLHAASIHIR